MYLHSRVWSCALNADESVIPRGGEWNWVVSSCLKNGRIWTYVGSLSDSVSKQGPLQEKSSKSAQEGVCWTARWVHSVVRVSAGTRLAPQNTFQSSTRTWFQVALKNIVHRDSLPTKFSDSTCRMCGSCEEIVEHVVVYGHVDWVAMVDIYKMANLVNDLKQHSMGHVERVLYFLDKDSLWMGSQHKHDLPSCLFGSFLVLVSNILSKMVLFHEFCICRRFVCHHWVLILSGSFSPCRSRSLLHLELHSCGRIDPSDVVSVVLIVWRGAILQQMRFYVQMFVFLVLISGFCQLVFMPGPWTLIFH